MSVGECPANLHPRGNSPEERLHPKCTQMGANDTQSAKINGKPLKTNTLDRDRTCNLQLRRLTLYPIELRGQIAHEFYQPLAPDNSIGPPARRIVAESSPNQSRAPVTPGRMDPAPEASAGSDGPSGSDRRPAPQADFRSGAGSCTRRGRLTAFSGPSMRIVRRSSPDAPAAARLRLATRPRSCTPRPT